MVLHNPVVPHDRRGLVVEVLHGTALHLDVPRTIARQAEVDAHYLARVHGDEDAARKLLAPLMRRQP